MRLLAGRFVCRIAKEREDPSGLLYVDCHPHRSLTRLAGYAGALQTDGYAVYQSAFGSNPQITLYGYWAHARRYFYKARDIAPVKRLARQALRRINGLYEVEHLSVRQELSVPILEARRNSSEKCGTRAMDYTLGRWPTLCRYTGEGRVDIDNNAVERAIRPLAVGRTRVHCFIL